jgi:hypothetical protein
VSSEPDRIDVIVFSALTLIPFFITGSDVQVEPSWTEPVGPAPAMSARHRGTNIRKSSTLTMAPMYWTQANVLLGRAKITRHITQKMLTDTMLAIARSSGIVDSQRAPWGISPSAHRSTRIQKKYASAPKTAVHPANSLA